MFKIYEKLGGLDATLDVIVKRRKCKRPGRDAVQHWHRVKTLPAIAIVALWEECRERKIRFSPDDCRVKQRPPAAEQRA